MKPAPKSGSRRTGGSPSTTSRASRTRDISGTKSRSGGASKAPSGGGADSGVARRSAKRAVKRRNNALIWGAVAVVTVVFTGTAAGVYSDCHWVKGQIAYKNATLVDLKAQEEIGKKHLEGLSTDEGKVRILVENGFIKPGQRLLLMAKTPQEKAAASQKKNDLVPQSAPLPKSFLGRIGRAWHELRGG